MTVIETFAAWIVFISAVALFASTAEKRISALMAGTGARAFDRPLERLKGVVEFALVQRRMMRDGFAGVYHLMIFWGFVFLLLRSWQVILDSLIPGLDLIGRVGSLGYFYGAFKDVFELLVLLGIALALFRRFFRKPERLENSLDAFATLGFIGLLMVSDLVTDATVIILKQPEWASFTPVSAAVAGLFTGFSTEDLETIEKGAFWVHLVTFLGFLNFLPFSKHFHIFTSLFNVYFRNLDEDKNIRKVDLEAEHFGISKMADLTWKEMLDLYTCTECGRCKEGCPTNLTGKPLKPKEYGNDLRDLLYSMSREEIEGRAELPEDKLMVGGRISKETIWACTTCRYCEWACPLFITFVPKLVGHRNYLTLEESDFPPEAQAAFKGMERQGNPWNLPRADRTKWAEGLDVPHISEVEGRKYLLWVGCAGAYEDSQIKVTRALVKLLKKGGVKFGILGEEENCTGDAARRLGNEYLFATLAEQNIETLKGYGVTRIVTACPHCLQTLKTDYSDLGAGFEVVHATELVADLVRAGRLKFTRRPTGRLAYHDPCYLGRYRGDTLSARFILGSIPGIELGEVAWSGESSVCCGAGGGRFWLEEKTGKRINHFRFEQLTGEGAKCIGVSCPFCHTMLDNARGELGKEQVEVRDVMELAAEALEEAE